MEALRFHQSYAKTLLFGCPAELQWELEEERRKPTRTMEKGTVVDQFLLGGLTYHTVQARDWRTKAAKQERDAARERGQVPMLEHEIGDLEETAGLVRSRLLEHGLDLTTTVNQQVVTWIAPDGTFCEGTPDIMFATPMGVVTCDLKVGERCAPDFLDDQVYKMCWDIQGAAYGEAARAWFDVPDAAHEHWIIRASPKLPHCITICPLSEQYMTMGQRRLIQARAIWRECLETNDWPEYESRPLSPRHWHLVAEGMA